MKPKRDLKQVWRDLCADLDSDDGQTSDELDRKARKAQRAGRTEENNKTTLRLCAQVRKAIHLALAGDCGDEHLQSLEVLRVEPSPNASRLRVIVRPPEDAPAEMYPVLHSKLLSVQHLLAHAVAKSINRKRAPKLFFMLSNTPDTEEVNHDAS